MNSNVIVMTEAGKPIFARYGKQGDIARICGLVQAIRTAVDCKNKSSALNLGEIQSVHSKKTCTVFMTVGSITLVHTSTSTTTNINAIETEAFARLRLEYIYAHLIFMLTANIQNAFLHNPGFDLRSLISSSSDDNLLRGILDKSGPEGNSVNTGPFLVSSVRSCFPISHRIRHKASKALQSVARKIENNIAFALLVVGGDKLLTVVQPSFRPHQLRVSDMHLILNFIDKQLDATTSSSAELWIPMCLPRFHSTGFLYAYTSCFDVRSKLTLILLSSHNTTEQFRILRAESQNVREALGLPAACGADSIIHVVKDKDDRGLSAAASSSTSTLTNANANAIDVEWKRTTTGESFSFDNGSSTSTTTDDEGFVKINVSADMLLGSASGSESNSIPEEGELLHQVRQSSELSSIEQICKRYLVTNNNNKDDDDDDSDSRCLVHFLFRLDVPIETPSKNHKKHQPSRQPGFFSQCIDPPARAPFDTNTAVSQQRLWSNYQKLGLRLRLGSATVEASMDAFDMIRKDDSHNSHRASSSTGDNTGIFTGIGKHCPAIGLHESPPYNSDGLSYIVEGDEIYLAMNGKHFELYMVATNNIPVKRAATLGTKLVREIIRDEKILFLSKPLTW